MYFADRECIRTWRNLDRYATGLCPESLQQIDATWIYSETD